MEDAMKPEAKEQSIPGLVGHFIGWLLRTIAVGVVIELVRRAMA